jgi:hypothetical protein
VIVTGSTFPVVITWLSSLNTGTLPLETACLGSVIVVASPPMSLHAPVHPG